MKTIKLTDGKIIRVTESKAIELVIKQKKGVFVPKSEFKKTKKGE